MPPLLLALALAAPPPAHLAESTRCSECHPQAAAEHAASAHAQAFRSSSFQRSWARTAKAGQRDPWCRSCHQVAAPAGIGCQGCHQAGRTPAQTCAGCHEFAFPRPRSSFAEPVQPLPLLMQATHTEHEQARGPSCARCHMPSGSHAFPGAALAPDALEISTRRVGEQVEIELTAAGVGHAVPTGDPFRRLRVSRCEDAACTRVSDATELGRSWRREGDQVRELADTRPRPGGPAVVRLLGPGDFYRVDLILSERGLPEARLTLAQGKIP